MDYLLYLVTDRELSLGRAGVDDAAVVAAIVSAQSPARAAAELCHFITPQVST